MKTQKLLITIIFLFSAINLFGQWQTNGDNISFNSGNVSIGTDIDWAKLNIGGQIVLVPGPLSWGTQIIMDAHSLKGGKFYTINSLGGNAEEGQGKFLINGPSGWAFLIDSLGNIGIGNINPQAKLQITDGDIFIESINKGIIMKSPDGQCWRGTLDNTGNLKFAQINCLSLTMSKSLIINNNVTLFPNPVNNRISINIEDYKGKIFNLSISNSGGQIVRNQLINSSISTVDFTNLTKGLYILSIFDSNGVLIKSDKILKE